MDFVYNDGDLPIVYKHDCKDRASWRECCDAGFKPGEDRTSLDSVRAPVDPKYRLVPIFGASTISHCFIDLIFPSIFHINGFW